MGFSYTCMSIGHSYNGDVKSLSHRLSVQAKKTNKQTQQLSTEEKQWDRSIKTVDKVS